MREHPGGLVFDPDVALQAQGCYAERAIGEDGDCFEDLAELQFPAGEDGAAGYGILRPAFCNRAFPFASGNQFPVCLLYTSRCV